MCLVCTSVQAVAVQVDMFVDVGVAVVGYGVGFVVVAVAAVVELVSSVVSVAELGIWCSGVAVGGSSASFLLNIFGVVVFVRIVGCWC